MKWYLYWTGMLPCDFSGGRSLIPFWNLIPSKHPSWNFTPFMFSSFNESNICSDQLSFQCWLNLCEKLHYWAVDDFTLSTLCWICSLRFILTVSVWHNAKNHLVIKHHIWTRKRQLNFCILLKNRFHYGVCYFQWRQVEGGQKMVGIGEIDMNPTDLYISAFRNGAKSKSNSQTSKCKGRWRAIYLASFSLIGEIMDCQR